MGVANDVRHPPGTPVPDPLFDLDQFVASPREMGVEATWYTAARCPCGELGGNAPAPDCPVCGPGNADGNPQGWIFPSSLAQAVDLQVTGFKRDQKTDPAQAFASGSIMFSVRTEHAPAWMDRYVLPKARVTKAAMLTRKSTGGTGGHVETLNYPIVAQTYVNASGGTSSLDVLYLRAADPTTNRPQAVLVKGTDFTITAGGALDFTLGDALGTAPAQGARMTIVYKTRPVFRVTSHLHLARETRSAWQDATNPEQHLPVNGMAMLEWFVEGAAA